MRDVILTFDIEVVMVPHPSVSEPDWTRSHVEEGSGTTEEFISLGTDSLMSLFRTLIK